MPQKIFLTRRQRKILKAFIRKRKTPQWLVRRSRIILDWAGGRPITHTARDLDVSCTIIYIWRERWWSAVPAWEEKQKQWSHKQLRERVREILSDKPRSGRPPVFEPEEVCQIIALACKKPEELGFPVSHWSAADLTRAVLQEKIVPSISERTVGRIIKKGISNPIAWAIG